MNREEIRQQLFAMQDTDYREFQVKLIPTVDPEKVIGVRTPQLRKFAKELSRDPDAERFLEDLPHEYFDENQLHTFLISELKDFDNCILKTERFLPQIDNWATCDQLSPKVFKKHRPELLKYIKRWIGSEHTYIIRFAVGMLMQHFLDEDYSEGTLLRRWRSSMILFFPLSRAGDWTRGRTTRRSRRLPRASGSRRSRRRISGH